MNTNELWRLVEVVYAAHSTEQERREAKDSVMAMLTAYDKASDAVKVQLQVLGAASKHAGDMDDYPVILSSRMPKNVKNELADDCLGNDAGHRIDPGTYPLFKAWLEAEGMPVRAYIVWWRW